MSRLLIAPLFLICSAAGAQSLSDAELASLIAKQRQTISIDADGCLKNPNDDDDVIVVCGEPAENRRQKLPPPTIDNDRIRRGEAVSTTKAASKDSRNCGVIGAGLGCIDLPKNWIKMSGGPVPMISYDLLMKGLPEPDMAVTEPVTALP